MQPLKGVEAVGRLKRFVVEHTKNFGVTGFHNQNRQERDTTRSCACLATVITSIYMDTM
jgi:hypothetical protein